MKLVQNRQTKFREKIGDFENKIPGTSGLVTTAVLNTDTGEVENKIPDVSGLVEKAIYDAKISNIEEKYLINDYYKFMSDILDAKTKQKEIVEKSINISNLVINSYLNKKLAKAELKAE